jgi:post-segregation antitoxin (ccd killing protein)
MEDRPRYDVAAPKQTVSLTLNSDLYARAKQAGINASRVAEQALAHAYHEHLKEIRRSEVAQDLAALDAFMETHGSFSAFVRAHRQDTDAAV